jgi:hypothetical protein
MYW